jgi:cytochrome c biogenesis protein CcmG/thiol:disulfide interchange protein DsbE
MLILLGLVLVAAGCGSSAEPGDVPPLAETSPAHLQDVLAASTQPVVLNVWASWCIPCRSEAPLLREADKSFGSDVEFIGLNVRDSQDGARSFLNEFQLTGFEHLFDQSGAAQGSLGAGGVPLTLFYLAGGELVETHFGAIDERTLALNIDEITRR